MAAATAAAALPADAGDPAPAATARLFLTGLPPAVSKPALRALLTPFAAAAAVTVHPRGFAFATLASPDAAARCVATLNRTSWRGATLRVERAREHYVDRLRRERRQRDRDRDRRLQAARTPPQELPCAVTVQSVWKGRYRRLAEDDDEDSSDEEENARDGGGDHDLLADDDDDAHGENTPPALSTAPPTGALASDRPAEPAAPEPRRPRPSAAAKQLSSTISLFGLPVTPSSPPADSPPAPAAPSPAAPQPPPRQPAKPDDNDRPTKRARRDSAARAAAAAADEDADPAEYDLKAERAAALSVLQRLFPDMPADDDDKNAETRSHAEQTEAQQQQHQGAESHPLVLVARRRALYRKLELPVPDDPPPHSESPQKGKKKKGKNKKGTTQPAAHGRRARKLSASFRKAWDDAERLKGEQPAAPPPARRRGLYRQLSPAQ